MSTATTALEITLGSLAATKDKPCVLDIKGNVTVASLWWPAKEADDSQINIFTCVISRISNPIVSANQTYLISIMPDGERTGMSWSTYSCTFDGTTECVELTRSIMEFLQEILTRDSSFNLAYALAEILNYLQNQHKRWVD
jgi:hypothetical protein